jgi:hypothetical protein
MDRRHRRLLRLAMPAISNQCLPVDQAVRVSTSKALFNDLSGSRCANFGDEISQSRRVSHHGYVIVGQRVQLSIRVWSFAIIAWVEPSRLGTWLRLIFHGFPVRSVRDMHVTSARLSLAPSARRAIGCPVLFWYASTHPFHRAFWPSGQGVDPEHVGVLAGAHCGFLLLKLAPQISQLVPPGRISRTH